MLVFNFSTGTENKSPIPTIGSYTVTVHFTVSNGHVDFSPEPTDQHVSNTLYQELDRWEYRQDELFAASAFARMLVDGGEDDDEDGKSLAWVWVPEDGSDL